MKGVGWRMPWTMAAFTVCAFGMIGVPPLAGFVTKWHIGVGAVVLPGVRIGKGAQIGAGAVVREDVPDFAVAAGVPARVSRMR